MKAYEWETMPWDKRRILLRRLGLSAAVVREMYSRDWLALSRHVRRALKRCA